MLLYELKETYRKNRHDLRGFFLKGYPDFVWRSHMESIHDEVPVFTFHGIEPVCFENQLRYLKDNGYQSLENADAFISCLQGEQPIQPNSILLTFDDGLEDLYGVAFPLLKRYGFQAVSFVVPTFVGRSNFCSWDQLREMSRSNVVDVQSHTLFHRLAYDWPRIIPCEKEICVPKEELERYPTMLDDYRRSKDVIEEKLERAVHHLCNPDFDGTEESIAASQQAGYISNYWGVIPGRKANRVGDDPFRVVRLLDDYLFRLPGIGRVSLSGLILEKNRRYRNGWARRLFKGVPRHREDGR